VNYYLDSETYLIEPGILIPQMVCLQDEEGIHLRRDSHDIVEAHLDAGDTFVAHSAAFDAAVLMRAFPDLAERIYKAPWECTKVREKLIYIAKKHPFKGSYSLAMCLKRHGIDGGYNVDADGQKDEYWRLHYSELDGVPVADWPEAAVRYAMLDVENVKDLYEWQEANVPSAVWVDLEAQTRADLDLHLLTAWGVHTDPVAVERFITKVTAEKADLEKSLLASGLITHKGKKRQKLAKERATKAFVDMGLSLDKIPLTPKGRQLLEMTPNLPAHELLPDYTSVDKDACLLSGDELLVQYARYGSVNTLLKRGTRLRAGVHRPLQPRYNVLVESGRTSCSQGVDGSSTLGFQIQNVNREPGLRECFVPRQGKVFFAADWSGAQLMGVTYEEAQRLRKAGDKHAKDMRQMGKAAMFGFPGGLGAFTFVIYAHDSYGVVLTIEEAERLKAKWLVAFPEMSDYFKIINRICGSDRPVEQLYSKRLRGGASYCATANTFFQGLASDMMKDALHRIVSEMYFPGGPSYMRKARLWGEIHDEFIGEAPLSIAPDVAERVAFHMAEAGKKWCPSSPPTAEPLLMSRWSKSAETVRDDHGRLQVFQVEEVL